MKNRNKCDWCDALGKTVRPPTNAFPSHIEKVCTTCAANHTVHGGEVVHVLAACEARHLMPVPGELYRFIKMPNCASCATNVVAL